MIDRKAELLAVGAEMAFALMDAIAICKDDGDEHMSNLSVLFGAGIAHGVEVAIDGAAMTSALIVAVGGPELGLMRAEEFLMLVEMQAQTHSCERHPD